VTDELYEDDQCYYSGGDPRLEEEGAATLSLSSDCIRLTSEAGSLFWPRGDVLAIQFQETVDHRYDLSGFPPEVGADVEVGLIVEGRLEPALSLRVRDPEEVYSDGFDVRIAFRSEYYAKAFAKRVQKEFNVREGI
jgi:hypothetical protein